MVGGIYPSYVDYYDKKEKKTKKKSRPILIISEPIGRDTEYTVLPVSTISNKVFYDPRYDISLKLEDYPLLSLTRESYVRCHKQTVIYKANIDFNRCVGNLKEDYPETYYEVMNKLDEFHNTIITNI